MWSDWIYGQISPFGAILVTEFPGDLVVKSVGGAGHGDSCL